MLANRKRLPRNLWTSTEVHTQINNCNTIVEINSRGWTHTNSRAYGENGPRIWRIIDLNLNFGSTLIEAMALSELFNISMSQPPLLYA